MCETATFRYRHRLEPIRGHFTPVGLCRLTLPQARGARHHVNLLPSSTANPGVSALQEALERYFSGQKESFRTIPLDLGNATAFRCAVWEATKAIPWGHTASYGDISERLGYEKRACQAVGQALHVNPVPIVIPCHRILAAGGKIGGFGAGLEWKRELLGIEGR